MCSTGGNSRTQASFYKTFCEINSVAFFEQLAAYLALGQKRETSGVDAAELEMSVLRECTWSVLRLLQLLCENHNIQLQNTIREQLSIGNKTSVNMVQATLQYVPRAQTRYHA